MPTPEVIAEIEQLRRDARSLNEKANEFYPSDDALGMLALLARDQDIRAVDRGEYPLYVQRLNEWKKSDSYKSQIFGAPLPIPENESAVSPGLAEAIATAREFGDEIVAVESGSTESVRVSGLIDNWSFMSVVNNLAAYDADERVLAAFLLIQMKADANSKIRSIGDKAFEILDTPRPPRHFVDIDALKDDVLSDDGIAAMKGRALKLRRAARALLHGPFDTERHVDLAMKGLELVLFLQSSKIKLPSRKKRAEKLREIREPVLKAIASGDTGELGLQMKQLVVIYKELVPALSQFNARVSEEDEEFFAELLGDDLVTARTSVAPKAAASKKLAGDREAAVEILRESNRLVVFDSMHRGTLHWIVNEAEVDQRVDGDTSRLAASLNQWRHIRLSVMSDGDGEPIVFRTSISDIIIEGDKPLDMVNVLFDQLREREDPASGETYHLWHQIGQSAVKFKDLVGPMPLNRFLGEAGFEEWKLLDATVPAIEVAPSAPKGRMLAKARPGTLFG